MDMELLCVREKMLDIAARPCSNGTLSETCPPGLEEWHVKMPPVPRKK